MAELTVLMVLDTNDDMIARLSLKVSEGGRAPACGGVTQDMKGDFFEDHEQEQNGRQ